MAESKPGRFGYVHILRRLADLHEQAGAAPAPAAPGGALQFDRRRVLRQLCGFFDAEEAVLLRRGFDRAYRQIVEGV